MTRHSLCLVSKQLTFLSLIIAFFFTSTDTIAQGFFELSGNVVEDGKNKEGVTVQLLEDGIEVKKIRTDKRGKFIFQLQYTSDYTVHFSSRGFVDMHMEVKTSQMPEEKRKVLSAYIVQDIMLMPETETRLDLTQFEKPFARLIYDGKRGFKDDEPYREQFVKEVSKGPRKSVPSKKEPEPITYSGRNISGSILVGDKKGLPLANKIVRLLDANGRLIQTVVTSSTGEFVFNKLPADEQFLIQIESKDNDLPDKTKLTLVNNDGNKVASAVMTKGKASFRFIDNSVSQINLMTVDPDKVKAKITGRLYDASKPKNPLTGVTFLLTNDRGEVIKTSTDSTGLFQFVNILRSQNYFLSSEARDPKLAGIEKLQLRDIAGNVIKDLKIDSDGAFKFNTLKHDQKQLIQYYVEEENSLGMTGNLYVRKQVESAFAGKKIYLKNEEGELIETTITNPLGGFALGKIPEGEPFSIIIDKKDLFEIAGSQLVLTDRNNKDVAIADAGDKGEVSFYFKNAQELKDMIQDLEDMKTSLRGRLMSAKDPSQPLAGVELDLTDTKGKVSHSITDDEGLFVFLNLIATQNYSISADGDQDALKGIEEVLLTNEEGSVKREIKVDEKGFEYQFLPREQASLTLLEVDDPWLELMPSETGEKGKEVVISENVYFPVNSAEVSKETGRLLEKIIRIMEQNPTMKLELGAHTDSRGKDSYNLDLSEKRAKATKSYMVEKGINGERLKASGYGETKLLNKCSNGVECTEQEHAKNRRVEFRVYY